MTADLASVPPGAPIPPVLTVPSVAHAGPLADALTAGGARCAEVAFRTAAAEQAVKAMAAHGALPMTTPGDVSTASLAEVEALAAGGPAAVGR